MYTKQSLSKQFSWYGWFVCSLAALFYCYEYLLRIEPSVMATPLRHHFAPLTAGGLGLLSAMYYWAYTPMQAVVGIVTDRFGPKRVLTLAIILCALGTFVFGDSNSILIAATGRFFVGCGSAFAFVGVLKLGAMWLPEKHFPVFVGLAVALGMFGALFGDIVMTWMTHLWGWHWVVMASVGVGIILVPIYYLFVHEKIIHEPAAKADNTLGHFFKGFINLLKNKNMLIAGMIGCLLYLSLSAFGEMWGIPFLQRVYPQHQLLASTLSSMVFLGWLVGAPINGWLSQRLQSRRHMLITGSLLATVFFTIIILVPHMPPALMGTLLFLFGVACSTQILCFAIGRDYVNVKLAATAAGVINMLVMLSGMFLQPLMSRMLDWAWHGGMSHGLRIYSIYDYQVAMTLLPAATLIAAILAFIMRETYRGD